MFSDGPIGLLQDSPLAFILLAVALIEAIALHEFAHAFAADQQGDRLPRAMGRVTLNPVRHLDPIGTILLFLVGFGWGKPVEFRPQALSSQRFGAALVALAGPMMNLLLAVVAGFGLVATENLDTFTFLRTFFLYFFELNVLLAVFNLIPLPPLDGSRLLTIFLPPRHQKIIFFLDRYGIMILMILLIFGGFTFLFPLIRAVGTAILRLTGAV